MKFWIVVITLALASLVNSDATPCDNTKGLGTFNPGCTSSSEPFCIQTIDGPPAQYFCSQCRTNCDCKTGYYCSSDTSSGKVGKCEKFSKNGKSCRALSSEQLTDLDYPEAWKCAILFSNDGNLQIDAQGACVDGKCRYCDAFGNQPGMQSCDSDGTHGPTTCAYPGVLVNREREQWSVGNYGQNPEYVWWAIFFVFFIILIGIQGATLFFTCRK